MKIKTIVVGPVQTNCYLVTDEQTGKTTVIDPGMKTPALEKAIKDIGVENVSLILLTHGHFDHITGLPFVRELTGAPVAIHEADGDFLTGGNLNLARIFSQGKPQKAADRLLKDGDKISCGALEFTVVHTPGHTPGGCCFLCGDTMFSGDTLFFRTVGRTDFPHSSPADMLRSIGKLRALSGDYTVLPGHDRATTLQDERDKNPYFDRENYDYID